MRARALLLTLAAVAALAACQKQVELASSANGGAEPVAPPKAGADTTLPPPPEDPADAKSDIDKQRAEQFPDYKPKDTADTVTDYRPGFAGLLGSLPSDMPSLARAFLDWKGKAAGAPGQMEDGAQQLGADAKEYKPSNEELMAAAAGDRLTAALHGLDATAQTEINSILSTPESRAYKRFDFRHVDVMGSGRYFYASSPKDAHVPG